MSGKIIERAYLLFLLLLPFVYFTKTIDPVLIPRQLFLSIFVGFVILYLLFSKVQLRFLPLKNPVYVAFFGYFAFALLSSFALFTSESHYVLSKQLLLFSFLAVTLILLYNKILSANTVVLSGIGFGIIAIGSACVQLIEKTIAGQNLFKKIEIINGLFANKNLLASVLFLTVPFFCMGLQLSKKFRWIAVLGLLGAFSIIIIIRTRAVLLASAIYVLIVCCFYIKNRFKIRKRTMALSGLASLSVLVVVYKYFLEQNIRSLKSSAVTSEQYFFRIFDLKSLRSRTQFWQNSYAMFKEHPLFGVGMGNWQVQFPKYGLEQFSSKIVNGTSTLQRPHNDFLHVLCENGIVGFVAYCAILGIIFYQLGVLIRKAETKAEQWKFVYILAGITCYIAISFFDFPMERIEHQLLLMLLFSITISAYYSRKADAKPVSENKTLLYCVLFIAVYSATVSGFRFKGEVETVRMYLSNKNAQWSEALYAANKATSRFYTIDPTSIPIDWYKGTAHFNRNEMEESIRCFESAYQTAPYQVQVINNLATAYLAKGEKEKAKQLFSEALKISPKMEDARLNLAAIYYNDKNYEMAFGTIDRIDIDSENKKYRPFLAQILIKKLNQVLALHPNSERTEKITAALTTKEKILSLYFDSRTSQMSFEKYVLDPNLVLK